MFKVVPDQLKISDGWVRCGHCADVFDASLYLEAWVPPTPTPQPAAPPMPAPEPAPSLETAPELEVPVWNPFPVGQEPAPEPLQESGVVAATETWLPLDPVVEPLSADALVDAIRVSTESLPEVEAQALAGPTVLLDPAAEPAVGTFAVAEPSAHVVPVLQGFDLPSTASELASPLAKAQEHESDFHAELERFATGTSEAAQPIRTDALLEPPAPQSPSTDPEADAPTDEPGFMRQARRRAFWRSPLVRASLGALAVFLSLLLGAQWALHERAHLAASHPDLAPLLARLCEPLGCEIGPVRRIDAVVIDSSTLVRRLGNFYSFDLVLKNNATIPVAVPALELSLTDTRDAVIARRVFLPKELPGTPGLLPAQSSVSLSLRLSIADAEAVPMAGYRALVFYP